MRVTAQPPHVLSPARLHSHRHMYVTKIVMSSSLFISSWPGRLCTTALAMVRVFHFLFLYCAQYMQDTATQREYRHLLVICSLFRRNPNQQYTSSPQHQSTSSPRASQAEHGTVIPKLILSSFSPWRESSCRSSLGSG